MGATILVADDDRATRKLYRDVLRHSGYELHEASTGQECLEQARRIRPALIVLDLHLPIREGTSAVADLRADPATRSTRILAISALADPDEVSRALHAGCDAVFNKPVTPRDLVEGVRTLLDSSRPDRIRDQSERQRSASLGLLRRDHDDLRALWAFGDQLRDTEIRELMESAQLNTCSNCSRVRLQDEWRELTPELVSFLGGRGKFAESICPDCLAGEPSGQTIGA